MLGSHFYNQIVRKNIIAFGTLFNNITMKSSDPDTGEVLEEVQKCSGSQFDPELVEVFLTLDFSEYDQMIAKHTSQNPL